MKIWVSVCDSSRLRIFEADKPIGNLREISDRQHSESREKEQQLVTDRPGVARGRGGESHTLAVEHDHHEEEAIAFAREVGDVLTRAAEKGRYDKLYILAAPAFLGHLRKRLNGKVRDYIADEIAVNLTKETPAKIRQSLGEYL